MRDGKVQIAIIGAGTVAEDNQLPAYKNCKEAEVVAICDKNLERAKNLADKFGISFATDDISDILENPNIDGVSVCTGNSTHEEIVTALAHAGKHILCEKPMAMDMQQARTMYEAVQENQVIFMMGFVNRFRRECQIIKKAVEQGQLGTIYHARCGWLRRRGTPKGWFTDVSKSGGGPVIDIGVHVIDLTWYLMGKPRPVSVSSVVHRRIGDFNTKYVKRWIAGEENTLVTTEDSATALIRFDNDVSMTVDVSWAINGQEEGMYSRIYGTKGGASLSPLEFYGEENDILINTQPVLSRQDGWQPAFDEEIRHFTESVMNGRTPISDIEDGLIVQKILNGIYESGIQKREICLL